MDRRHFITGAAASAAAMTTGVGSLLAAETPIGIVAVPATEPNIFIRLERLINGTWHRVVDGPLVDGRVTFGCPLDLDSCRFVIVSESPGYIDKIEIIS